MKWFTSDWHLFHENIIRYCDRPYKGTREMNRDILEKHNSVVAPEDTVYVLGDVTMAGSKFFDTCQEWVQKFNGTKHLILGNHDKHRPFAYIEMGFESVHTSLEIPEGFKLVHDPALACTDLDSNFLVGHVHGLFTRVNNALNVGVDVHGFYPINMEKVVDYFQ